MTIKLIGAGLSPFVRKVRVVCAEKGIAYEHDPMIPVGVSDEYRAKHPLGKVPLLEDGDRVVPDSSAICAYLERIHPNPPLYPSDAYEHARAIWYEEFGDEGLVKGAPVPFRERVLAAAVFGREPNEAEVEKALTETLPPFFDYLQNALGDDDYLIGNRFSIADVSIGSQFASFACGGCSVDAGRWPTLAAYVERVHARPSFKGAIEEDLAGIERMRQGG